MGESYPPPIGSLWVYEPEDDIAFEIIFVVDVQSDLMDLISALYTRYYTRVRLDAKTSQATWGGPWWISHVRRGELKRIG